MKIKLTLIYILASLVLNMTALYIIVGINRALYTPDKMTYYMKVADFMGFGWRVKLFYLCLGSALTWIFVLAWDWMLGKELFRK